MSTARQGQVGGCRRPGKARPGRRRRRCGDARLEDVDGPLGQPGVGQAQQHGSFDQRHCAGEDARVVAALGRQLDRFVASVDRVLNASDRGGRLEGHPADHRRPVGDAPLDAAGAVGFRIDRRAVRIERIVGLAAPQRRTALPVAEADLKAKQKAARDARYAARKAKK